MATVVQAPPGSMVYQAPLLGVGDSSQQDDKVNELKAIIKERRLTLANDGATLSDDQVSNLLASIISLPGYQTENERLDAIKRVLNSYPEGTAVSAKNFFISTSERIDDDVIEAYKTAMGKNGKRKDALRDELKLLAAELKVYSVIQSTINAVMAKATKDGKGTLRIVSTGDGLTTAVNLLDMKLYGYTDDANWKKSSEFKFLSGLDTYSSASPLTIYDFLTGSPKASGAMAGADLMHNYEYKKDNNPMANLATSVSDRSRPVSDTVNLKTTELNDISSRYNAAVESLNKFIEKLVNTWSAILRAI